MGSEMLSEVDQSDAHSLAQHLGSAIAELPAYQAFEETRDAVKNSETAQEKIAEFEQAREQYMLAQQSGDLSQADIEELQGLQAELNSIPVMEEHLEAKARLTDQLAQLNEEISEPLAVDFGREAGGCCED